MLCDLRGDRKDSTPPFRGREYISSWLTSAASDLQKRIVDLAKRKAGLTSLEETAEKATLTRTEEVLLLWYLPLHGHINAVNPLYPHSLLKITHPQ